MPCAGESDCDDWPVEQEVVEEMEMEEEDEEEERLNLKMEPLLCDSPALLPTLTLTLAVDPASATSLSHTTQLNTQVRLLCIMEHIPEILKTYSEDVQEEQEACDSRVT